MILEERGFMEHSLGDSRLATSTHATPRKDGHLNHLSQGPGKGLPSNKLYSIIWTKKTWYHSY